MEMKLYCIVSNEAVAASGGNRGKMIAQAGHAYVHSMLDAMERFPDSMKAYLATGVVAKIALKADEMVLHDLWKHYKPQCGVYLVKDAGITVFPRPMITALGIGPIDPTTREPILAGLKMFI